MYTLMNILVNILNIYYYAVIIYIFMSWVPSVREGAIGQALGSIVEPFLNIFRPISPTIGFFDLSPIFALLSLRFLTYIFQSIAISGSINALALLLGLLAQLVSIFIFIAWIFWAFVLIRTIGAWTNKDQNGFFRVLDSFVYPNVMKIMSFFIKKPVKYKYLLAYYTILLFILIILSDNVSKSLLILLAQFVG